VHCDIIGRHVPILLSLPRTRTAKDSKIHFDHHFKCMECQSFDEFSNRFPGNISDFVAAEQGGFIMSLLDLATTLGHEIEATKTIDKDVDVLMQKTYKFCEVSQYYYRFFERVIFSISFWR
jgi:hypothetical protein